MVGLVDKVGILPKKSKPIQHSDKKFTEIKPLEQILDKDKEPLDLLMYHFSIEKDRMRALALEVQILELLVEYQKQVYDIRQYENEFNRYSRRNRQLGFS